MAKDLRPYDGDCWLVLGASSALARACAEALAAGGANLILAGRDLADLQATATDLALRHDVEAQPLQFDALAMDGHADFAKEVAETCKGTLHILLAFGVMPSQAEVDAKHGLVVDMMNANLTGAASVLHHLAPKLEAQGAGRVVVIGSVAGDRGRAYNYVYGASKAGLAAYTEGLRARMYEAGVSVTLVKPGPVDTAMTWSDDHARMADVNLVAGKIVKSAYKGKMTLYVPFIPWWPVMQVIKHLPDFIMARFIRF